MSNKGKCIGVSVGPGDQGQITLEALDAIKNADIVFLPTSPKEDCTAYKIIKDILPSIDDKELLCETFTMARDGKLLKQRHQEIFEIANSKLDEGKDLVFLALGEVALFSTYIYIHEMLIDAGYESNFVPGISSVQAIAAKLSVPLASGGENVHVFADTIDLPSKLALSGTKVFMKTRKELENLVITIQNYVKTNPGSVACGVSNCGMEGEIIARNADELSNLAGYFTVIFVKDAPESIRENVEGFDYSYYENHSCKYYPCHKSEHLNCMFCYCPMYHMEHCPGNPTYIEKEGRQLKVCSNCTFPHDRENYPKVMKVLRNLY